MLDSWTMLVKGAPVRLESRCPGTMYVACGNAKHLDDLQISQLVQWVNIISAGVFLAHSLIKRHYTQRSIGEGRTEIILWTQKIDSVPRTLWWGVGCLLRYCEYFGRNRPYDNRTALYNIKYLNNRFKNWRTGLFSLENHMVPNLSPSKATLWHHDRRWLTYIISLRLWHGRNVYRICYSGNPGLAHVTQQQMSRQAFVIHAFIHLNYLVLGCYMIKKMIKVICLISGHIEGLIHAVTW